MDDTVFVKRVWSTSTSKYVVFYYEYDGTASFAFLNSKFTRMLWGGGSTREIESGKITEYTGTWSTSKVPSTTNIVSVTIEEVK